MTSLRLLGWVVAISAVGGTAAGLTGGDARKAIGWYTPMAIGVVLGLWLAKR